MGVAERQALADQRLRRVRGAQERVGAGGCEPPAVELEAADQHAERRQGTGDVRLTGSRTVPALVAGGPSTGTVTVTVPSTITPGPYRLFACADDLKVVKELSDTNNCALWGTMTIIP